jgi:hypothetical protein
MKLGPQHINQWKNKLCKSERVYSQSIQAWMGRPRSEIHLSQRQGLGYLRHKDAGGEGQGDWK